MSVLALLYHDVTPAGEEASSGFPGPDAALYKLSLPDFAAQLETLAASSFWSSLPLSPDSPNPSHPTLLFTFDDGGLSALTHIAPALERHNWRGYFFITTDWIGRPGFLSEDQIRELDARGHIIGSHSCSHPLLMARLPAADLDREWRDSTARLASILGRPITVASVPGGHFSQAVARSAARSGICLLFNSEPTTSLTRLDTCRIVGRFSIQRNSPPSLLAAFARGDLSAVRRQRWFWNFKKLLKKAGGPAWLAFRRFLLSLRQP